MKEKEKTDGEKLRDYLGTIPVNEYNQKKNLIIYSCKIKSHTLNNWIYGLCKIPELAKEKIEEVTKYKIF